MKNILLILLFVITNFIAWNYFGLIFILNCVILFYFLDYLKNKRWYYAFIISFILFILFNVSATFWLIEVDDTYSIYAFLANSLLMLLPFSLAISISKFTKNYRFVFILLWVLFEMILTNWDLAWPWLNLGNVLGNQWYLIKWYSLFGSYSGSLWFLFTGHTIYLIGGFKS